MSAVHGGPGDLLMYPDTDGKAYLIYNKYQGEIPQGSSTVNGEL